MKSIRYKGITIYEGNATKDGRKFYFKRFKNNTHYTSKKYKEKDEVVEAFAKFVLKNENPINKNFNLVAQEYFDNLYKTRKESSYQTYLYDYNKHIKPYFEKKYINKITTKDINKWGEKLEKNNYTTKYLNKIRNILKAIFNYAIKYYDLESNPVISFGVFESKNDEVVNDSQKLKYITKKEFDKFISVIEEPMWKTWFICLWYTGCRKGELRAITWNDVNFNTNTIYINKTLNDRSKNKKITSTKNNINRPIAMNNLLKNTLFEYKKEVMKYSDFSNSWLVFGNTNYISRNSIDRKKDYYFKLSGVRRITNHQFRHSIITYLANNYIENCIKKNINIDSDRFFIMLSIRDGHSVETLKRTYMHLFPTTQNELVDILNNE